MGDYETYFLHPIVAMESNSTSPLPNWKNSDVALATLFVVAVGLAFWIIFRFWLVIFILFIAIVISIAITPAVEWLHRRRLPRAAGVILIYLLLAVFVVAFILLVAPLVVEQAAELGNAVPGYYQDFREWLLSSPSLLIRRIGLELPREMAWFAALAPASEAGVPPPEEGVEAEDSPEEQMLGQIGDLFGTAGLAARGIFSSLAVFLLAFYWTLDGERTIRSLLLLIPQKNREGVRNIYSDIQVRVGGYIRGVVLLSLIVGSMALIAYLIIRLPYALSLAIVAGIMEAVPIIGPGLGALPALLVAFSLGEPGVILAVLASTVIIQMLENTLLGPRVMDKSVGVNPILTLLALATFTSLLGIPGALLAVPIAAIFQLMIERFLLQRSVMEEEEPLGRDSLSALRLEVKEISTDARKHIREKDGGAAQESDRVEESIEEIADELDRLLSQVNKVRATRKAAS